MPSSTYALQVPPVRSVARRHVGVELGDDLVVELLESHQRRRRELVAQDFTAPAAVRLEVVGGGVGELLVIDDPKRLPVGLVLVRSEEHDVRVLRGVTVGDTELGDRLVTDSAVAVPPDPCPRRLTDLPRREHVVGREADTTFAGVAGLEVGLHTVVAVGLTEVAVVQ